MNSKIIAIIIVLVLIIGGFLLYKKKGEAPTQSYPNTPTYENTSPTATMPLPTTESSTTTIEKSVIKEITISTSNFAFSSKNITVNKGETVKLTLKNTQGTHNLKLDAFNVGTRILNTGEDQTITFVADKAGSFEFYCSVGNHRAMGMVGSLVVK